jgi:2-iminobutanoate/2-iminopropanoate deaminase
MPRRHVARGPGLAPAPAPISQAVVAGDQCWVSGQLAVDEAGTFHPGTAREEATLAFANVFAALSAAGFAPTDIVYVDVAFIDLADLPAVNALWAELFAEGRGPARTVYQAAALPYGGRVKVQAVAVRERPAPSK